MTIDDRIDAIYQRLRQEISQVTDDAIASGNVSVLDTIVLTKCSKAKTDITTEWAKILRGGKGIPKELGMLDEFDSAMKSLAELRKLKSEVALKKQKMQESWSKLVTHDPDVVHDPNLPNPYSEREGGTDYDS